MTRKKRKRRSRCPHRRSRPRLRRSPRGRWYALAWPCLFPWRRDRAGPPETFFARLGSEDGAPAEVRGTWEERKRTSSSSKKEQQQLRTSRPRGRRRPDDPQCPEQRARASIGRCFRLRRLRFGPCCAVGSPDALGHSGWRASGLCVLCFPITRSLSVDGARYPPATTSMSVEVAERYHATNKRMSRMIAPSSR